MKDKIWTSNEITKEDVGRKYKLTFQQYVAPSSTDNLSQNIDSFAHASLLKHNFYDFLVNVRVTNK